MTPFTVVVLYPKFAVDRDEPWPGMTYTAHIHAPDFRRAIFLGTMEAMLKQENERRGKVSDWIALVTFEGHHNPVAYAWTLGNGRK